MLLKLLGSNNGQQRNLFKNLIIWHESFMPKCTHCFSLNFIALCLWQNKNKEKANKITKLRDPVGQNFKGMYCPFQQKNQTKTNVCESLLLCSHTDNYITIYVSAKKVENKIK